MMQSCLAALIALCGEAVVLRLVARIKYFYANYVAEDMKAKVDGIYAGLYGESKDLGNPTPPDENSGQGTPPPSSSDGSGPPPS